MTTDQDACILTEENIATEDDCTTHDHEADPILRDLSLLPAESRALMDAEAKRIIDKGLSDARHRSLISSDEVTDMLLDLRRLLVPDKG